MTATSPNSDERITPDDIEAKFRELADDVDEMKEDTRSYAVTVGAVVIVGLAVAAFWLGRRRGRKSATVVEIRRV